MIAVGVGGGGDKGREAAIGCDGCAVQQDVLKLDDEAFLLSTRRRVNGGTSRV